MATIKLSDAIREGSKLFPVQVRDGLYFGDRPGECCALGAALVAISIDNSAKVPEYEEGNVPLDDIWPELSEVKDCPHVDCNDTWGNNLYYIISDHLNDQHGWTREQIADWLQEQGY